MPDPNRAPLVSAIIVVLNGETFLAEAIDSIRAQSLGDWELIVVDDGSTDGTERIVRDYCRQFPSQIRLLSHPDHANLGIAASRNLGIGAAQGRYVAFLDADDVWSPTKLAEQVAIMEADPELGMIYGRSLIWHSWDDSAEREDYYYDLGVTPNARYEPPALFLVLLENAAQTPTTCNAMIRRSLFDRVGRFDPRQRGMFEDLSFFGKSLAVAPTYVSDRSWAKYRQHGASCTASSARSWGDEYERLKALRRLDLALDGLKAPSDVRHALRAARRRALLDLPRPALLSLRKAARSVVKRKGSNP